MLDWLPAHKCGLYLTHNEHKDVYDTVERFYDIEEFYSEEDYKKCCKTQDVWALQWYPKTPVGSYKICGSSIEMLQLNLKENSYE